MLKGFFKFSVEGALSQFNGLENSYADLWLLLRREERMDM
jgi:hypothetical protein